MSSWWKFNFPAIEKELAGTEKMDIIKTSGQRRSLGV
jgi:hypothetical protein